MFYQIFQRFLYYKLSDTSSLLLGSPFHYQIFNGLLDRPVRLTTLSFRKSIPSRNQVTPAFTEQEDRPLQLTL